MIASAYIDNYSPGAMVILKYFTSEISPRQPRSQRASTVASGD
jgi:hypothetical protein